MGSIQSRRRLLLFSPFGFAPPPALDLSEAGWQSHFASDVQQAVATARSGHCRVGILLCAELDADRDLLPVLEPVFSAGRHMHWIALLSEHVLKMDAVRRVVAEWFYDFHTLPIERGRLLVTLGHAHGMGELSATAAQSASGRTLAGMVGESRAMRRVRADIAKIAGAEVPVLVTGETGTGKELIARAIHENSARAKGPFIAVNCGALPPSLIQSELFGYEKGAFTGASQRRQGRIEAANGGTLFLDEIGDLPPEVQAVLLRFLQEGAIQRVGATHELPVDVRVVAATHVNLERAIHERCFREDLYYRLNVLSIQVPPLRARAEDVEPIARYFLDILEPQPRRRKRDFAADARSAMLRHHWPGNVRELMNRVQRAMVMAEAGVISARDLGLDQLLQADSCPTLEMARLNAERAVIDHALVETAHNVTEAAKRLKVSRRTLYRLMERHGLLDVTDLAALIHSKGAVMETACQDKQCPDLAYSESG